MASKPNRRSTGGWVLKPSLSRNEMWCAVDNHNYMYKFHICAKGSLDFNFDYIHTWPNSLEAFPSMIKAPWKKIKRNIDCKSESKKIDLNETLRPFLKLDNVYMPPWYFLGAIPQWWCRNIKWFIPNTILFQHEHWEETYQLKIAWVVK